MHLPDEEVVDINFGCDPNCTTCPPEPHVPQTPQPLAISVVKHSVGVNMGDHAQDVIKSLSVPPATTVEELMRKYLVSELPYSYGRQYDNFLVTRLNEPWDFNES